MHEANFKKKLKEEYVIEREFENSLLSYAEGSGAGDTRVKICCIASVEETAMAITHGARAAGW